MGVPADSCKGERTGAVSLLLLGPNRQTVTIPVEDLDAIASLVDEDEEVAGEGIEREDARDQRGEAVETFPVHPAEARAGVERGGHGDSNWSCVRRLQTGRSAC